MKTIDQLDPNFLLDGQIPQNYIWQNPQEGPFQVWGLVPNRSGTYCRLPEDQLGRFGEGVRELAWHLSGGCVRFSTDSPGLAVIWKLKSAGNMAHFTACGQSGLELFEEYDGGTRQIKNFLPRMNQGCGCCLHQSSYTALPKGMHSYVLYLPLYNGLEELQLGFAPDARVGAGRTPAIEKPIVFYGSSITQGGCASKCGSSYTNLLSRRLDAAQINLGFSGNAKGEREMAEYIAGLEMSAFVLDYDHNAPNAEHLEKTHEVFFQIIRAAQPDLPILILSRPDTDRDPEDVGRRCSVILRTWENARKHGDRLVWMLEGKTLFGNRDRDLCTVDGCHPNDIGFLRMADAMEPVLREMLGRTGASLQQ